MVSPRPAGPSEPVEARLQQYIPKELLAKLEAAREGRGGLIEGERRIVTVLFSDVRGSTGLAEVLDPEEWAEVMNGAFECLIKPVYHYEGVVARLMGDGILAFFGAPIAHEDDPQRAVQAGLDIIECVRVYGERVRRERGLVLDVRVGVNTGLAVVGEVGSDLRVEYTAMGDAVNVAARMEETGMPGAVQISGDTYKRVAPLFDVESLGRIPIRGKSEAVDAYRVTRSKSEPGRLRGIAGLNAPLVGREQEMAVLRRAITDLTQERGQILCLIGEAGLGKSRLIEEVRAASADGRKPGLLWRESHSPSYMTSQPYGAFRQLIRRACGAVEEDSAADVRAKIASSCTTPTMPAAQRQRALRAFETLLGVPIPGDAGAAPLQGEAFKNELFQSMLATWRAWAEMGPVVLVFDDLHWADPASIALLIHLFQLVDEVPILFLCAFRPDRDAPAWQLKQAADTDWPHRYTELLLRPLSMDESDVLVDSLLAVADLPSALRALILHKADGNPFFVEEVIRELIEEGVVVRDEAGLRWRAAKSLDELHFSIPDNLQALLAARIDRLEEQTRHTLQLAAVIGRTFFYRVLLRVEDMTTELDRQLRALQRGELIREESREPELEYAFRHALTQEAAYNSILLKRRRQFHRRVGEALEELFPDRKDEYASQLAHHFYEARDARALSYSVQAGDTALRLYANAEAVCHYSRALEVAGWDSSSTPDLVHLYGHRGRALELDTRYDEALNNYREMEAAGREREHPALELAAVVARAVLLSTPTAVYNPPEARALCDQALELARELGDHRAAVKILWIMMLLSLHQGELEKSIATGEQALLVARQLNVREELASVVNDLIIVYESAGDLDRARAAGREARALWRELRNQPMLIDSLAGAAGTEVLAGNFEPAIELAEEADQIGQAIGNLWGQAYSRMYVGYAYMERGEYGRAIQIMESCLRLAKEAGFVAPLGVTQADLGLLYARLGAVEHGLDLLVASLALTENKLSRWQDWVMSQLARVQILTGHLGAAEDTLRKAAAGVGSDPGLLFTFPLHLARLELASARSDFAQAVEVAHEVLERHRTFPVFVPEVHYLHAQALLGLGRSDDAWRVLGEARRGAKALGSRRMLWPILAALGDIEQQRGHASRAEALYCEARAIVRYIADHVDQPELRDSFLALPDVKAVLARSALGVMSPRT